MYRRVFHSNSIGIELIPARRGGALVKSVLPGSEADDGNIKRGFKLAYVRSKFVGTSSLHEILADIRMARPISLTFVSGKTRIRKIRVSGGFPIGLELAKRKPGRGGVLVKSAWGQCKELGVCKGWWLLQINSTK